MSEAYLRPEPHGPDPIAASAADGGQSRRLRQERAQRGPRARLDGKTAEAMNVSLLRRLHAAHGPSPLAS
jgi:hypothetical protein